MKLQRLGAPGQEKPYVIGNDGRCYDAAAVTRDFDGEFFATDGIARLRKALDARSLQSVDVTGWRIGAPVARPGAVICVGQNYAGHAAETGAEPPEQPILFLKHPNTVVGPNDEIMIPRGASSTDWEVELAVVIGKRTSYLSGPDQALSHIAGFTISNDVSERVFQIQRSGGQWSKGKCSPTFNPLGPWLLPASEVSDVQSLRLRSWVNGELRQDSSTADMIFSVAELIHDISQYMTLDPGDVINTGTPQGVALSGKFPFLVAGDTMSLSINELGEQRQTLVQA